MARLALGISYQGNHYFGWQTQQSLPSVQAHLEKALSQITGTLITTTVAGRTDAGVHAVGQVVDFETEVIRPESAWTRGVNSLLPEDIRVHWAQTVPDEFNARRKALWRQYVYVLYQSPHPPAIYRKGVAWTYRKLNVEAMQRAAKYWIGEHDFSAFRGAGCQAIHARRHLYHLDIHCDGSVIVFSVKANAFLLHMVRNFVGTLLVIGREEKPIQWAEAVLHSRDRKEAGQTAAASGLYLYRVGYPAAYHLPIGPHEKWCLPSLVEKSWQAEHELV